MEQRISQVDIDAIALKTAKIVMSELRKAKVDQDPPEMVSTAVAARILGVTEVYMRRIKDRFPHIKSGSETQGRLLFVRDALLREYAK